MRYLSVCSGIEAATVAWHPLGWTPVGFSEIEAYPSAVLAHHYPNVPNFGDMKNYANWKIEEKVDLLVGGTPCQSFSVAGLRKGLSDPRGGLMLTYLEIAQRFSPEWIVWENVPGVLSANGGRDFGSFLGALGDLGYGWAYRVMDAQWVRTHGHPHAVPQRRRRVFVVGYRGDFTRPAKVLFESQSLQRHSRAGSKAGQDLALHSQGSVGNGCWWDGSDCAGTLTKKNAGGDQRMPDKDNFGAILQEVDVAKCLAARSGTRNREDGDTYIPVVASTLSSSIQKNRTDLDGHGAYIPVPYDLFQITAPLNGQRREPGDPCHTLARDNASHAAIVKGTKVVRRLTPMECEKLQGFQPNYTNIPWRGKPESPDGHRYKALGNSMAVNCMEWIGERIQACIA